MADQIVLPALVVATISVKLWIIRRLLIIALIKSTERIVPISLNEVVNHS